MWRLCDLHVHTTPNEQNADPFDGPRLISESIARGVQVIAVANHDHLRGLHGVIEAAYGTGLEVIAGVEVSTDQGHLLVLAPGADGAQVIEEFVSRAGIQENHPRSFTEFVHLARNEHGPSTGPYAESILLIGAHVDQPGSLLGLQVPAPNEVATRHLLSRGFRLDPWVNVLMSNRPFGRFDRLISFGPTIFL